MVERAASGAIVVTGGAVVVLCGTFLPWLRSGARNRSSFAIFDLVERLGFAPNGVVSWSLRLWPLVPLLLVGVTVLSWAAVTGRVRWGLAAVAAVVVAGWVGGTATAIFFAPDLGLFVVGAGPAVTLAGIALVCGGILALKPSTRPAMTQSG